MSGNYFCVDFGESSIQIADIKRADKTFEAAILATLPLPSTFFPSDVESLMEKAAQDFGQQIASLKIGKKNVALVLPDSLTFNQIVEMPSLKEKEMLSAIRYQADQFIPLPLDEINLDVEILDDDKQNNKKLTLISAAPKRIVEKVQHFVEYNGFVPVSLETEMSAIGRLLDVLFKNTTPAVADSAALFVNLNPSATSLYYFEFFRGIISLSHSFNRGYNIFVREVATNLNIQNTQAAQLLQNFGTSQGNMELPKILSTAIKDFATELSRFIQMANEKTKKRITNIYLFKAAYEFNSLDKILERYFAIPTSNFDLYPFFHKTSLVESTKNQLGYFVSAVGGNLR